MMRTSRAVAAAIVMAWSAVASAQSSDSRLDSMFVRVSEHIAARRMDAAKRELVLITVEFPMSPRFPDALMQLADIERAGGDPVSARRRLERIVRDHMESSVGARAALALGEQLMVEGGVADACAVLDSARVHVPDAQVELANRIAYAGRQCAQRLAAITPAPAANPPAAAGKAPADSAPRPAPAPAGRAGRGARGKAPAPAAKGPWTVQVAAHKVRGDALRLEARLKARGYDVRIFGTDPYRVRIGKFTTRAEAATIVARLRTDGHASIVVEDERR